MIPSSSSQSFSFLLTFSLTLTFFNFLIFVMIWISQIGGQSFPTVFFGPLRTFQMDPPYFASKSWSTSPKAMWQHVSEIIISISHYPHLSKTLAVLTALYRLICLIRIGLWSPNGSQKHLGQLWSKMTVTPWHGVPIQCRGPCTTYLQWLILIGLPFWFLSYKYWALACILTSLIIICLLVPLLLWPKHHYVTASYMQLGDNTQLPLIPCYPYHPSLPVCSIYILPHS